LNHVIEQTGWLAKRLPHIRERSAYDAIGVYRNVDPSLFAQSANIPTLKARAEVAKAAPDIQALIAERVEAGDI
jgi:hypothetical protein